MTKARHLAIFMCGTITLHKIKTRHVALIPTQRVNVQAKLNPRNGVIDSHEDFMPKVKKFPTLIEAGIPSFLNTLYIFQHFPDRHLRSHSKVLQDDHRGGEEHRAW